MGKYAYVKIEYYIISQTNEFVNSFYKNVFKKLQKALAPFRNEGGYFIAKPPKKCYDCLFRVRIIPAKAPIKAIGAVLTNNHSNA